jgi:hypothetical protein
MVEAMISKTSIDRLFIGRPTDYNRRKHWSGIRNNARSIEKEMYNGAPTLPEAVMMWELRQPTGPGAVARAMRDSVIWRMWDHLHVNPPYPPPYHVIEPPPLWQFKPPIPPPWVVDYEEAMKLPADKMFDSRYNPFYDPSYDTGRVMAGGIGGLVNPITATPKTPSVLQNSGQPPYRGQETPPTDIGNYAPVLPQFPINLPYSKQIRTGETLKQVQGGQPILPTQTPPPNACLSTYQGISYCAQWLSGGMKACTVLIGRHIYFTRWFVLTITPVE